MTDSLNLLFSIDDNYLEQLEVTLFSIWHNSDYQQLNVYVFQKKSLEKAEDLARFCQRLGASYYPIIVDETIFSDAPATKRYPDAIYFRLLAQEFLPHSLDRILYLDADILCLNDVSLLYSLDLTGKLYAAASHVRDGSIVELFNKFRLNNHEIEGYFNTGVLLINLEEARQVIERSDILQFIKNNKGRLLLPDQDILNGLYGELVLPIPDEIYNYDARYPKIYFSRSHGEWDMDWLVRNTVFVHFCGTDKPWKKSLRSLETTILYKHYQSLTQRFKKS
ncbi:glycosyltransferase family 8 protein [Streptococcus dentapri]|uniref:Glycosyltransferase family 8 protein n=1 Tax=Streptococcus dentapri TaxID=573564 RepID=A0ABV8D1W5_9STRE